VDRPNLYDLHSTLSAEDFALVVATEWKSDEAPSRSLTYWLSVFRLAVNGIGRYVTDTEEPLPNDLTIWRGVARPRYARGMSWTLDRERAEWFARRFAAMYGDPRLYTATVDSDQVLGYLQGRQESEIVLDPRGLPRLRGQPL